MPSAAAAGSPYLQQLYAAAASPYMHPNILGLASMGSGQHAHLVSHVEMKKGIPNNNPEPVFLNVYGAQESIPRNESASECSLAGRYDNPNSTRFLAPIDFLKNPALIREKAKR